MTRNSSVRQALEAGLGISVVPELTLYQFGHAALVTRPLPLPATFHRRIHLVQRREGSLSATAQGLCDLIVQTMGRYNSGASALLRSSSVRPERAT